MDSEERVLPLFPLNTVLFPGAALPLQIFEDRYKEMLQDCLASDSRFGAVLIKEGVEVGGPAVPHTTGTMAEIVQVSDEQETRRSGAGRNPRGSWSPVWAGSGSASGVSPTSFPTCPDLSSFSPRRPIRASRRS